MDNSELENRFAHHPPSASDLKDYETIRERALNYAHFLNALCPDSREKSLALTRLEAAASYAIKAIARHS